MKKRCHICNKLVDVKNAGKEGHCFEDTCQAKTIKDMSTLKISQATKFKIYKKKLDITNECTLENGKSNPYGWSQYEIRFNGQLIGWLENGNAVDFKKGYSFK